MQFGAFRSLLPKKWRLSQLGFHLFDYVRSRFWAKVYPGSYKILFVFPTRSGNSISTLDVHNQDLFWGLAHWKEQIFLSSFCLGLPQCGGLSDKKVYAVNQISQFFQQFLHGSLVHNWLLIKTLVWQFSAWLDCLGENKIFIKISFGLWRIQVWKVWKKLDWQTGASLWRWCTYYITAYYFRNL